MFKLPEYCFYTRHNEEIVMLRRHRYGFVPVSSAKSSYELNDSIGISIIKVYYMYFLANYIWLASAPSKWKALGKTILTIIGVIGGLALIIGAVWGFDILLQMLSPKSKFIIVLALLLLVLNLIKCFISQGKMSVGSIISFNLFVIFVWALTLVFIAPCLFPELDILRL